MSSRGSSRIDYVCGPIGLRPFITKCSNWRHTAKTFQNSPYHVDHLPVAVTMRVAIPVTGRQPASRTWNRDMLSMALQRGTGREAFCEDLQQRLLELTPHFQKLEDDMAPDQHAQLFIEALSEVGLKHYAKSAEKPEWFVKVRERKLELLKKFATLKKEIEPVLAQEVRQKIVDHSKIMRNYNRALARKYNKTLEEDIKQAAKDRRLSDVHRLSRKRGGKRIGVKKRDYRSLDSCKPSAAEWQEFLESPPQDGGFKAAVDAAPSPASPSP